MSDALTDQTFHSLAEEFLKRRRDNNECTVESFASEFPHLKEEILDEFPGILFAEQLKQGPIRSSDEFKVPAQIGRYIVGQELGRGGMGIVYAARHPDLNTEVAIKILPFEKMQSPDVLRRFHAEARTCASMEHPNIVPVYDYGIDVNFAYLVMRRVKGVSLDKLIDGISKQDKGSQTLLDWSFVGNIGAQAAQALQYAHEKGFIHRDIKPANLILENDGRLWVSDFGLAKILRSNQELSATGDVVGTPRYMAPEQLRGTCDVRSDIYGLGISLYELAAGKTCWDDLDAPQLLSQRKSLELTEIHKLNPNIPESLSRVVMRASALQPEDRYQSAKELNYVLNRFAHGSPNADRRRYSLTSRQRWHRKDYMITAYAAMTLTILLAGLGIGWFAIFRSPSQDPETVIKVLNDDPNEVLKILDDKKARAKLAQELPDLLIEIAQTDNTKVRTAVAEITHDVVDLSLENIEGSEEEKKQFKTHVNELVEAYEAGGIDGKEFGETVNRYANSPVNKIQRLHQDAKKSGLSDTEKAYASQVLFTFQERVFKRTLEAPRLVRIMQKFEKMLRDNGIEQPNTGQISDSGLREFFRFVIPELASAPMSNRVNPARSSRIQGIPQGIAENMPENLEAEITKALKDPRAAEILQQINSRLQQ